MHGCPILVVLSLRGRFPQDPGLRGRRESTVGPTDGKKLCVQLVVPKAAAHVASRFGHVAHYFDQ